MRSRIFFRPEKGEYVSDPNGNCYEKDLTVKKCPQQVLKWRHRH